MEELIIKQAPKQLQMEVAQQLKHEKEMQASMMIGAKSARTTIKSVGKGDVRFGIGSENDGSIMESKKKKDQ